MDSLIAIPPVTKANYLQGFENIDRGGRGSPAGEGWLECNLLFHGALLEGNHLQPKGDE
jgi:hypothetical protein